MKNSIRFLLTILCLIIALTACEETENLDKEVQQSTQKLKIEKSDSDNQIVKGIIYHVLNDEYLVTNDENNPTVNIFFREYVAYDGNQNSVFPSIVSVSLPKEIVSITEAKEYLQSNNPDWLKLKSLTIISEKILSGWKAEDYHGDFEYWNDSPEGLTLEKIKQENK